MNTTDWAEEPHNWFQLYHRSIAEGTFSTRDFFFDLELDSALWQRYRSHPLLVDVSLDNWQPGDFDLLEQVRGWEPLIRQLPRKVPDYRLLTLIRRSLYRPLSDKDNHALVSRQQWTLMELIRWKEGYNQLPEVLSSLRDTAKTENKDAAPESSNSPPNLHICTSGEDGRGRYVIWKGQDPAQPGDTLVTARPFSVALYDPGDSGSWCFHCARKTNHDSVRELTLLCPKCRVWSYCSTRCRGEFRDLHERECTNLPQLLDKSTAIGVPCFKTQLVYRAVLQKQHRKDEWDELLKLENHYQHYDSHGTEKYLEQATKLSEWMKDKKFVEEDFPVRTLVELFLSININAIGLGPCAVGLFPGIPSMFNHSCLENVTHGWNDREGTLQFRAVEMISMNQECHISYVSDLEQGTIQRNRSLIQYKFFTCNCRRCMSPSEEGRLEAIQEWKECLDTLERGDTNNAGGILRRLVDLAEVIFPSYYVTKGWAMEECAHVLMQDSRCINECLDLLQKAREQYETCRGDDSELVRRVDGAIRDLNGGDPHEKETSTTAEGEVMGTEAIDDDEDGDDDYSDQGWATVLLEVKTFEPQADWKALAEEIRSLPMSSPTVLWSPSHRVCEIGFGIQTLVVACQLQKSGQTRIELVEEIQNSFTDIVQNVDYIDGQNYYSY